MYKDIFAGLLLHHFDLTGKISSFWGASRNSHNFFPVFYPQNGMISLQILKSPQYSGSWQWASQFSIFPPRFWYCAYFSNLLNLHLEDLYIESTQWVKNIFTAFLISVAYSYQAKIVKIIAGENSPIMQYIDWEGNQHLTQSYRRKHFRESC